MTRPARARRAGEPAPLLLVTDDRERGEALLAAIGHPDAPLFDAKAIGGWEVVPAGTVILFERAPDLSRTRRRLRFARGSRTIVVAWPDQPRLIELALREKGTVVTWPGDLERLADELRRCLATEDGAVVIDPERLADELCQELARRLRRSAPHLRLADATRVEVLVERLTDAVLAEARELSPGPAIDDLDWEHVSTAVQTREESAKVRKQAATVDADPGRTRPLRPPPREPDPVSVMETRPYAATTEEQADLIASVELLDDGDAGEEGDAPDDEAPEAARPPPLPLPSSYPAVSLPAPRRRPPLWLATGVILAAAGFGVGLAVFEPTPSPAPRATSPAARAPRATLELGAPTVTPVVEPAPAPPEAEVAPPPAPVVEPATAARDDRASRASVRARAHLRRGRFDRALRSAQFAARLAPDVESYAALVAEIEAAAAAAPAVTEEPDRAMLEE